MHRLVLLVAACVLAGCRGVLGIEPLPAATRDAGGVDASSGLGADARADVDLAWSRWRVNPDGPPEEQFTFDDAVVLDTSTGLSWQRDAEVNGSLRWEQAAAACAALSLGGKSSGWRLPTRIELASITDYRTQRPAIGGRAFPTASSDAFWTASSYAPDPTNAWTCRFDDGAYIQLDKMSLARFRCVHD